MDYVKNRIEHSMEYENKKYYLFSVDAILHTQRINEERRVNRQTHKENGTRLNGQLKRITAETRSRSVCIWHINKQYECEIERIVVQRLLKKIQPFCYLLGKSNREPFLKYVIITKLPRYIELKWKWFISIFGTPCSVLQLKLSMQFIAFSNAMLSISFIFIKWRM